MEQSWIFRLFHIAFISNLINMHFSHGTVFSYTDESEDYLQVIEKSNMDVRIHERLKRDTLRTLMGSSSMNNSIVYHHVFANDSNDVAFVFWKHADTSVILILTCQHANITSYNKHSNKGCKSKSNFYRSIDHGKHFQLMTENMQNAHFHSIYLSPIDKKFIILTDYKNQSMYITKNEGVTFKKYKVNFSPTYIYFHPSHVNTILGYDNSNGGDNSLYVSNDWGFNWTLITRKVRNYFWGRAQYDIDNRIVFIEKESGKQISSKTFSSFLYASMPPYLSNSTRLLYNQHLVPFSVFIGKQFIVTQHWHDRNLYISSGSKGGFSVATFDKRSTSHVMHVVISDAHNEILLALISPNFRASLYISDHTGTKFMLRKSNILTETIRSIVTPPKMDFYQVKGSLNTYIVNTKVGHFDYSTSISFDKGYTWREITCDKNDVARNISSKRSAKKCQLFLYLKIELPFSDFTAPIFSKESAPGIIIVQGFIAKTLPIIRSNHQVFMSIDGGYTWKKMLSTSNGYVLLDHGGVIAATPLKFTVNHRLSYTMDYGHKWHSLHLTTKYARIAAIITETTARILVINVFGFLQNSSTWIVWKIDFSKLLKRQCIKGDYTTWNHNNGTCIMGQKTYSKRRKVSSRCISGPAFNSSFFKITCECENRDFRCDENFYRIKNGSHSVCIPVNPKHLDQSACKQDDTFLRTQGYVKLYGDKCINGVEKLLSPKVTKCEITKPSLITIKASATMEAVNKDINFFIQQFSGFYNATYIWKFPDLNKVIKGPYKRVNMVTHKFSKSGKYNVTLTASNRAGETTASIVVDIIDNLYANAFITYDQPVIANVPKIFTLKVLDANETLKTIDHLPSTKFMWSFNGVYVDNTGLMDEVKHTFSKTGHSKTEVQVFNPVSYQTLSESFMVYHNGVVVDLFFSVHLDDINPLTAVWVNDFGIKLKKFLIVKYNLENDIGRIFVRGKAAIPTKFSIIFVDTEQSLNTMGSAQLLAEKVCRGINISPPIVNGFEELNVYITKSKLRDLNSSPLADKNSNKYTWVYIIFILIIIVLLTLSVAYLGYRHKRILWCFAPSDEMITQLVEDMEEENEFDVQSGQEL